VGASLAGDGDLPMGASLAGDGDLPVGASLLAMGTCLTATPLRWLIATRVAPTFAP